MPSGSQSSGAILLINMQHLLKVASKLDRHNEKATGSVDPEVVNGLLAAALLAVIALYNAA